MPDPTSIRPAARQALEDAILHEIERLGDAVHELGRLDQDVYQVGLGALGGEAALALWLAQPTYLLRGRVPLSVLGEKGGREEVLNMLQAWQSGDLFG